MQKNPLAKPARPVPQFRYVNKMEPSSPGARPLSGPSIMEDDLRPAREEDSAPARFSSPFDAEHRDATHDDAAHVEERLEFLSCDPFECDELGEEDEERA